MHQDMHVLSRTVEIKLSGNPRLTLREISRSIGTDRHNIEDAIRAEYAFNFRELKKRVRLKIALALLTDDQLNYYIKEIASTVGVTPNALSRFIRSMTGRCATDLRCHK